ncbi:ATP-dependent zinc protease family protein [Grimontia sp. NTOU-MAR1]|uniref:ATP-dependent zinc protease family protein n=1 Tax=Grimontia sp. NTOU-MAR1 TaxID=3111011 RepID=UPI002DBEAC3E|nr:ATP-dependent zinc protease [Grimontia sp. NTOU-MAR1]WRV99920.1 ATP-dependent zinc protease [Grimontia sp. NTOU-MAR1]
MKQRIAAFLLFLLLSPLTFANAANSSESYEYLQDGKLVMGEKEWVRVDDINVVAKARVDTGATTSSISAIDIKKFNRDGQEWVSFRLAHDGKQSELMEFPVVRTVHIIQSSAEGYDRRYVVEMPITIGDVTETTEFTLRDRHHLNFPVLLGRTYLKDIAVVDVSRQYVQPKPGNLGQ